MTQPIPLSGSTLLVGPMQSGKTTQTARALERYLEANGPAGVVVLDFAPTIETDDGTIGGRLDDVVDIPAEVYHGTIEARGPRSEGETPEAAAAIARENAEAARRCLRSAPVPTAVFVNDATLALQHDRADVDRLRSYCDLASCAVINAYRGDEFGADDPITRTERAAVDRLVDWADRVVDLSTYL